MYQFLSKNGQSLAFGLGVLITVIFLLIVMGGLSDFSALSKEEQVTTPIFNFGISAALFLTVATMVAMVVFGVLQVVGDVKGSMKGIIGLLAMVGVFVIAYMASSGTPEGPIKAAVEKVGGISEGAMKFIGGSITTALILVAIAFGAFIVSEVRNFFK
ncbi:MAG: hypothetical protein H6555_07660 [Lewinellaceae bacterium]|nr:hypothetical protein [Lewinellaceae bacterium]